MSERESLLVRWLASLSVCLPSLSLVASLSDCLSLSLACCFTHSVPLVPRSLSLDASLSLSLTLPLSLTHTFPLGSLIRGLPPSLSLSLSLYFRCLSTFVASPSLSPSIPLSLFLCLSLTSLAPLTKRRGGGGTLARVSAH